MDTAIRNLNMGISRIIERATGEIIYLIVFALFISEQTLETTMWELPYKPMQLIRYSALFFLAVKILYFDDHRVADMLLLVFFIVTGVLVKMHSGETSALFFLMFLYGARGVSFERILKVWLICSMTFVGLTLIGSYLGVVIDLEYHSLGVMRTLDEDEHIIRHSLGIIFPTDLSAHFFGIMMVIMYLNRVRIRIWHCVLGFVFTYWLYHITYARNNAICMTLLCLGYAAIIVAGYFRSELDSKYSSRRGVPCFFFYSMPICGALSFIMNYRYDSESSSILNKWLEARLSLGQKGLVMYPPNLFGHHVIMQGAGKSTQYDVSKYFFLDCSYLYTGLRVGMVFLMIVMASSVIACYRRRRDAWFALTIFVISIFGIAEHHLDAMEYIPFFLAATALVDDDKIMEKGL